MPQTCPQCGSPIDDDKKFCTACGHALAPDTAGTHPAQPPGKNRNLLILAAGICVILLLAAALILFRPGIVPFITPPVSTVPVTPLTTSYVLVGTVEPSLTTVPITITTTVPVTTTATPPSTRAVTCPSDRRACQELCVDTLNDPLNCGACGTACDISQICQQGICRDWCPPGQTSCPDGCHDLLYDTANCGICGNLCPAGLACNRSTCMPPLATAIPTYAG